MSRRLQAFLVLGMCLPALPALAQDATEEPVAEGSPAEADPASESASDAPAAAAVDDPAEAPPVEAPTSSEDTTDASGSSFEAAGSARLGADGADLGGDASGPEGATTDDAEEADDAEAEEGGVTEGWDTFVSGYFRAPLAIGISTRPSPDDEDGPPHAQLSYAPTRTVDSSYYSFAYTRLQETDWAEVFIHAKRKHVEAVVGWMGYWYQSAGFRNYDASWAPGMAYLTLDSDFEFAELKPHIAWTAGAWWPKFGAFDKYDTYTLGRMRQVGEQIDLKVPLSADFTATLTHGFGTSRDGNFNVGSPPPYQATIGLDLIHYANLRFQYGDFVDLGLHYNTQWTRDPNLFRTTVAGKSFTAAREADLTTIGGELTLSAPVAGSLWVSPSMVSVKNGWALGEAGVEVMHSLSAEGIAANYLAWTGSLPDSTGTGKLTNLGFLYENSLSGISGKPRGSIPDVTLNVFGLFTDVALDLPAGSQVNIDRLGQFKYGADVELQALDWLGVMLRWDEVNYNLGSPGYVFSAITPRLTFSSHFLSGESIYIQYSRYRYGDRMVLAGKWPWGTPLVAGTDIFQGAPAYVGEKPDMDVVKVQATIAF